MRRVPIDFENRLQHIIFLFGTVSTFIQMEPTARLVFFYKMLVSSVPKHVIHKYFSVQTNTGFYCGEWTNRGSLVSSCNVWCIKSSSKHSSNRVLCLLRNLMHQTLSPPLSLPILYSPTATKNWSSWPQGSHICEL